MADSGLPKRANRVLDCIGLYCPVPVLNTRQAMDELDVGEILEVWADDPAAEEDLKAWAKHSGQNILEIEKNSEGIKFMIKKEK